VDDVVDADARLAEEREHAIDLRQLGIDDHAGAGVATGDDVRATAARPDLLEDHGRAIARSPGARLGGTPPGSGRYRRCGMRSGIVPAPPGAAGSAPVPAERRFFTLETPATDEATASARC